MLVGDGCGILLIEIEQKINVKKQSQLRKIVIDVFSKSTMHGVAKIFETKLWFIKIMWSLILIISIISFLIMSFLSILNYNKHEVTTKIRTVHERPTLFPMASLFSEFI